MICCGLDFGTSNSAIGVTRAGDAPTLVPLEDSAPLMPSAVFFNYETKGQVLFGTEAIQTYVGQTEGRLMRALKTILGSPLIDETTALGYRRVPLTEVVEIFIRHLKSSAEAFVGQEISAVVHGRPVHFVDGDETADAKAQDVLRSIAKRSGFRDVVFVYEPIAAAYHYEETSVREEIVLVADIGGGTSDFSVIRIGPDRRSHVDRSNDILANAGVRVGGTDFDTLLSLDSVMPELGLGSMLVEKNLPVPASIYFELATWATINFTYTARNERELSAMVADSVEPRKTERLLKTIRNRLGHRIAFAVEDAKIGLSSAAQEAIALPFLEHTLAIATSRDRFEHAIAEKMERLHRTSSQCVADAGLKPDDVQTLFFTGGSGRVPAVRKAISRAVPSAMGTEGSDFLSVALGLTREAARRFR